MNERIKELWEESTLSIWPRPGKFTAGEYDYNLKAFADALLREYIAPLQEELNRAHKIVVHNERDWGVREVQITLLTNLIQDAKEHFGVEE